MNFPPPASPLHPPVRAPCMLGAVRAKRLPSWPHRAEAVSSERKPVATRSQVTVRAWPSPCPILVQKSQLRVRMVMCLRQQALRFSPPTHHSKSASKRTAMLTLSLPFETALRCERGPTVKHPSAKGNSMPERTNRRAK